MSATEIPSGRGRLRMAGMGQTLPEPTPATAPADTPPEETASQTTDTDTTPAARQPRRERAASANGADPTAGRSTAPTKPRGASSTTTKRSAKTLDGPYADEKKAQVNPRIYPSIWSYYEDLVDELPRHQRHGALTALVNAVLAQNAPGTAEDAFQAIQWLRQAETRERPA